MGSTVEGTVEITWIDHASIKLQAAKTVYIDPFSKAMHRKYAPADLIVTTHSHFDHFDPDAIDSLIDRGTVLLAHRSCDISDINCEARLIDVGDTETAHGIPVEAVQAYNDHRFRNPGEPFHPMGQGMGVLIEMEGTTFYHAGDTDHIDEMAGLSGKDIDVAFLPIGGTYTMDASEALEAVKTIQPSTVIPIHYDLVEGTDADPHDFKSQVENRTDTQVIVLQPD